MEYSLKKMLGVLDEGKREYRFVSGEVTQEEYNYCQLIDQLLFGVGGYVETLGPTWSLVHDTRFSKIENTFVLNRRAIFGGNAQTGKQYISSDGQFTSLISDLESYSEILGEGRYFCYILQHPSEECPLRKWYLRIFEIGVEAPEASPDLKCTCPPAQMDIHDVKDAPDEFLWTLIRKECPNYFTKEDKPSAMATRLFDLFRADLLGLVHDYALTPYVDTYIELDTGGVLNKDEQNDNPDFVPHVFLEVDILEKALTQRAVLRATAAKILRQIGFHKVIKDELGEVSLTDMEKDKLLHLVYNPPNPFGLDINPDTNWFGFLSHVKKCVTDYVIRIKDSGKKFKEREREQLSLASDSASAFFDGLKSGEIQPINQYSEPEVGVPLDPHAEIMEAILRSDIKKELFIMWVEAERRSNDSDDEDRLNMHQLYSILTPIFTNPDFVVGEEEYNQYMEKAVELGFFGGVKTDTVDEVLGDWA